MGLHGCMAQRSRIRGRYFQKFSAAGKRPRRYKRSYKSFAAAGLSSLMGDCGASGTPHHISRNLTPSFPSQWPVDGNQLTTSVTRIAELTRRVIQEKISAELEATGHSAGSTWLPALPLFPEGRLHAQRPTPCLIRFGPNPIDHARGELALCGIRAWDMTSEISASGPKGIILSSVPIARRVARHRLAYWCRGNC